MNQISTDADAVMYSAAWDRSVNGANLF